MEKKNIVYFDFINIIACLCVVGMHCNGIVHTFSNDAAWHRSFIIEVLAYWAVPGFFMLSGATMMNYRERYSTKTFIKRRIFKIATPLAFWTIVLYAIKRFAGAIVWEGHRTFINMLTNFSVEGVYWFFGPLIAAYLTLPVLSKLCNDKTIIKYILGVGVCTIAVFPLIFNFLGLAYNGFFYFPITGGYVIYLIIGHYLHNTEFSLKQRLIIYALSIGGLLLRYFHTAITLTNTGAASRITWEYTNLPALTLAVGVFVLCREICKRKIFQNVKFQKVLRELAGCSFGVYLIHISVITVVLKLFNISGYSIVWQAFGAIVVYLICLPIVYITKKTKIGNYIFP